MIEMPDFPPDAVAFTCRLRKSGAWRVMFAPAGGLGWSKPCCEEGHADEASASQHGGQVLQFLLSRPAPVTLS